MASDKSQVFLENPFDTANYASQAVFWWMNPFIKRGFKKDLELKDLYKPPKDDISRDLGEKLQNEWDKELYNRRRGKNASFVRALYRTFGFTYIITGIWIAIGECIVRPLQAVSLGWVIHDVNIYLTLDAQAAPADLLNEYYMRSFYGGLILIFLSIVSVLTTHPYVFCTQHTGMKVRVACCNLIYRHSLKLSRAAIGQTTIGQMVNLLSNDVNRFDIALNYLQYLIIAPLQAIIAITLLSVYYLGFYATIAGSAVLLLYVPFQSLMGRWFSKLRLNTAMRTDERVRLMNEIIPAMRVIKMYVWEEPFAKLVELARENEVRLIRHTSVLRGINMALFFVSSKIILFLCFITYVELGYILDAEIVFVSITLFNAVRLLMTLFFPYGVAQMAETLISCSRLQEFLLLPEQESSQLLDHSKLPVSTDQVRIECRDVSARWKILASSGPQFSMMNNSVSNNKKGNLRSDSKSGSLMASTANMNIGLLNGTQNGDATEVSALRNITFRIKSSQLMVIVGRVGSGKSSVLMSILGELPITSGQMTIRGKISYSAQEAWIFSGTVRDNVLFGKDYNYERYKQVLSACALDRDIDLFPQGDDTLVGERGVSLSGGQKARVNLARAIYYDADIYLLDDPLSAVDAAVAKHIFDNCIRGFLKDKTVILVTHQIQFAKSASNVLYLDDGKQISFGNYSGNLDLMDFAGSHTDRSDSEQGKAFSGDEIKSMQQGQMNIRNKQFEFENQQERLSQRSLLFGSLDGSTKELTGDGTKGGGKQDELTGEAPMKQNIESMTLQSTGFAIYWYYIKMTKGIILIPMVVITNIITQVLFNGSDFWLSYWTDTEQRKAAQPAGYAPVTLTDTLTLKENTLVYSLLILSLFLVSLVRTTGFFIACMRASITMHNRLFRSILKAPIKFFDYTPIGILLNRISRDMGIVDDLLPPTSFDTVEIFMNVIGILVTVTIIFPVMVVPAILMLAIVGIIRLLYMKTVRSIKTIEGVTRSPVFSHLATSLNGLSTIRAFGVEETFGRKFDDYQDLHSSAWFLFIASSRWLGVALDWLSLGYIAVVTLVMTLTIGTVGITGSQLGLAISSALVLSGSFQWGVRQSTELESQMTSVARIQEYSELDEEPPAESEPDKKPSPEWPEKGKIEFNNVTLRYFENEEPVLKNMTFTVNAREKVGIVGRTGAGKSSMIAVLFRLTETEGSVVIDGIDTKSIGLADLRKKISIIPQEPILFNGPVRRNLDPFSEYNDEQLWKSLAQVQLKDVVMDLPGGLDAKLNEGGSNFSVGQRQLICLARAVLRQNRILILDEATANVDPETDKFIQKTIRSAFDECTVLTIAHRLNTIMDSDKVLVLDAGKIKEYGEPHKLASIKGGWFSNMVDKTENLAPKLRKIAERSFRAKRNGNANGRRQATATSSGTSSSPSPPPQG